MRLREQDEAKAPVPSASMSEPRHGAVRRYGDPEPGVTGISAAATGWDPRLLVAASPSSQSYGAPLSQAGGEVGNFGGARHC